MFEKDHPLVAWVLDTHHLARVQGSVADLEVLLVDYHILVLVSFFSEISRYLLPDLRRRDVALVVVDLVVDSALVLRRLAAALISHFIYLWIILEMKNKIYIASQLHY